jgi:3-hydroxyacyl-[acyl-carrier-protein] dehydratase
MLLDSFFRIESVNEQNETTPLGVPVKHFIAGIIINRDHPIFSGHFPGNPVVPGVCQVQMILETFSSIIHRKVKLTESDNVKFLSMINPVETPGITLDLLVKQPGDGIYSVQASIAGNNVTCLKFKGSIKAE